MLTSNKNCTSKNIEDATSFLVTVNPTNTCLEYVKSEQSDNGIQGFSFQHYGNPNPVYDTLRCPKFDLQ